MLIQHLYYLYPAAGQNHKNQEKLSSVYYF